MKLTYGEWAPDDMALDSAILDVAENCFPSKAGYAPFPQPVDTPAVIPGTITGMKRFERTNRSEVFVVGTTSDLYFIVGGALFASALSLSAPSDQQWSFEQFGPSIYATKKGVGSYYVPNIDTDVAFVSALGTPPSGDSLAQVGDFLLYGNLEDIDSSDAPFRLRWSRFNDPNGTWGTDIATQSGFIDFPSRHGPITGISGGEVALVMQRNAVHRLQATGGTTVFRIDIIPDGIGCISPNSVVRAGTLHFWRSEQGFVMSDGGSVRLISSNRIADWIAENADQNKLPLTRGAVDFGQRCVVWTLDLASPLTRGQVIYNWELDRFSYGVIDHSWIVGADGPNKGSQGLTAIKSDGTLATLTGASEAATFQTGFLEMNPGRHTFVQQVRPVVQNRDENDQLQIFYKSYLGQNPALSMATTRGPLGYIPVNIDARYISFEHTIAAGSDWDKAQGLMVEQIAGGVV